MSIIFDKLYKFEVYVYYIYILGSCEWVKWCEIFFYWWFDSFYEIFGYMVIGICECCNM